MEQQTTSTVQVPRGAIELYNLYIHGHMPRREFLEGLKGFAIGGLTLPVLVEALMPNYARGQQVSPTDPRLTIEYVTVQSPQGNGSIRGLLARPASVGMYSLPGILVVHENRGLNPHIEDVARRFAVANFIAFAPDALTSVGGYPGDDERGGELFRTVDRPKMAEDFVAAADWLRMRADCTGQIGATGFCFGGGIANMLAVRLGENLAAAAPFYGSAAPAEDVPDIQAAILVHHGAEDTRLVEAWPEYEAALQANNVTYEAHIYPGAGHGFNNDATPARYNQAASEQAMSRTIEWFNQYVRG